MGREGRRGGGGGGFTYYGVLRYCTPYFCTYSVCTDLQWQPGNGAKGRNAVCGRCAAPSHPVAYLLSPSAACLRAEIPIGLNGFVNASKPVIRLGRPFSLLCHRTRHAHFEFQKARGSCNRPTASKGDSPRPDAGHVNLAKHVPRQIARRRTQICFPPCPFKLHSSSFVRRRGSRIRFRSKRERHLRKTIQCAKTAALTSVLTKQLDGATATSLG